MWTLTYRTLTHAHLSPVKFVDDFCILEANTRKLYNVEKSSSYLIGICAYGRQKKMVWSKKASNAYSLTFAGAFVIASIALMVLGNDFAFSSAIFVVIVVEVFILIWRYARMCVFLNVWNLLCSVYFASVSQSPYLFNVTAFDGKCCFPMTFCIWHKWRNVRTYTMQCMRMPTLCSLAHYSFLFLLLLLFSSQSSAYSSCFCCSIRSQSENVKIRACFH